MAVIVEIADSEPSGGVLVGNSRAARGGEVKKLTVASVPVEEPPLLEFLGGVSGIDLRLHVTVGDD
jgi:hypothetical protein